MKTCMFFTAICGLIMTLVCLVAASVSPVSSKQQLKLTLVAEKVEIRAGQPIILWLAVYNNGASSVEFDARMHWPGNIGITVWTPGASRPIGAESIMANIPLPSKKEMMLLAPKRLYGRKIVIGPGSDAPIWKDLTSTKPGRYTFQASYHSVRSLEADVDEFTLKSNKVVVVVK